MSPSSRSSEQRSAAAGAVTQLLSEIEAGHSGAADELLPIVYAELRKLAGARMRHEPAGHTLEPTALVHEAYLRLVGTEDSVGWGSRAHFFGAAAEAMRRILIERARRVRRVRHGGALQRVQLLDGEREIVVEQRAAELLDLDQALDGLAVQDERMARVVKLRFFAGLEHREVAEILDISQRTAERAWTGAKAWLRRELQRARESSER